MFAGLGISTSSAPLTDDEDEFLERFFAFGLNLTIHDFDAMPQAERYVMAYLNQRYRLNHLLLTRTAVKKQ